MIDEKKFGKMFVQSPLSSRKKVGDYISFLKSHRKNTLEFSESNVIQSLPLIKK